MTNFRELYGDGKPWTWQSVCETRAVKVAAVMAQYGCTRRQAAKFLAGRGLLFFGRAAA